jgi:hypothetical protein
MNRLGAAMAVWFFLLGLCAQGISEDIWYFLSSEINCAP